MRPSWRSINPSRSASSRSNLLLHSALSFGSVRSAPSSLRSCLWRCSRSLTALAHVSSLSSGTRIASSTADRCRRSLRSNRSNWLSRPPGPSSPAAPSISEPSERISAWSFESCARMCMAGPPSLTPLQQSGRSDVPGFGSALGAHWRYAGLLSS